MARPTSADGGRPIIVAVRLSKAEAADLDSRRGSLSRGQYLRALAKRGGEDLRADYTRQPPQKPRESPY